MKNYYSNITENSLSKQKDNKITFHLNWLMIHCFNPNMVRTEFLCSCYERNQTHNVEFILKLIFFSKLSLIKAYAVDITPNISFYITLNMNYQ